MAEGAKRIEVENSASGVSPERQFTINFDCFSPWKARNMRCQAMTVWKPERSS
ncbi:MAG: hypothetical protein AAFW68_12470 [Pseudomonadota bacterium]